MLRRPARSLPTPALIASALAAGTMLAGCYYPGGPFVSVDRFTYESTTWSPKTITLIDTRTGQPFWSVDIPVGQQLVVDFTDGRGTDTRDAQETYAPDLMQWEVMPIGRRFGTLTNKIPVPPASSRRLDMSLRAAPELPADMMSPQNGQGPTVIENRGPTHHDLP